MEFEPDASTVFSGVEIKGGVAVTYRDEGSNFGAIETFVPYEPLRSVLSKVQATGADVLSGMAYGDEETTLAKFDQIIPADVFLEVTSVTVEQFRLLRDGGDIIDPESGETVHFEGQLFDPVVFDDSVHEFINLRGKLANYFDDGQDEDIFDYVPPQKTNQIFTPRNVVVKMVDLFEQENPGCFNDPDHTFADLYMESLVISSLTSRRCELRQE